MEGRGRNLDAPIYLFTQLEIKMLGLLDRVLFKVVRTGVDVCAGAIPQARSRIMSARYIHYVNIVRLGDPDL